MVAGRHGGCPNRRGRLGAPNRSLRILTSTLVFDYPTIIVAFVFLAISLGSYALMHAWNPYSARIRSRMDELHAQGSSMAAIGQGSTAATKANASDWGPSKLLA